MTFEIFMRPRARTSKITFTKRGSVAFNVIAAGIISDHATDRVFLLWDAVSKRVAVRPTAEKDQRVYTVRVGGFRAVAFFAYIGYDFERKGTKQFAATWNEADGVFEIDLKDEIGH